MKKFLKYTIFMFLITLLSLSRNDVSNAATTPLNGNWSEGFDNINTLQPSGWVMTNKSDPIGTLNWYQGNSALMSTPFNCYEGANPNSYIGANYCNTGSLGTISNWLITPEMTLNNGSQFTFYTRKPALLEGLQDYPDRLEVRMSTSGSSVNVGQTATSIGDFSTISLSINTSLAPGGYPVSWTKYTVTVSGLPESTSGRFAFHYFVTNAGEGSTNADSIGIDSVSYVARAEVNTAVNIVGAGATSQTSTYNLGSQATVQANANSGYTFLYWKDTQGHMISTDANYSFTVTKQTTLVAYFRENGYLTVNIGPEGAVTDGAKWCIDGVWQSSGTQLLPSGTYTISFKDIVGWDTPAPITDVVISKGQPQSFNVSYQRQSFAVDIANGTGYTIQPDTSSTNPVFYGGSYKFKVQLDASYSNSIVVVKANGTTLTPVDGLYTIDNITTVQTVEVIGVQLNTYTLNLPKGTGYSILAESGSNIPVAYGGSYKFKVQLAASYSNSIIVMKANGKTLTPVNGVYSIDNITTVQTVTVTGLQLNTYSVNLPSGTGYSILAVSGSTIPVAYGGSYKFKVQLAQSYSNSIIVVKANGTTLTPVNGIYTIANITKLQTVTVTGVQINKYKVTVVNGSGSGNYAAGTQITIIAKAAPAGQVFEKWISNGTVVFKNATSSTTTFTTKASQVTITAVYTSIPKTPKLSVTVAKGKFTATWTKISDASGYEVAVSKTANGNFTVSNVTSLSFVKTGLKKGETFYIKVRAYKVVNGKKIYSSYSSIVKVTIKNS